MVTWDPSGGSLNLLKKARELIGSPEYVRVFWRDGQVAIVPTHEGHENAYSLTDGSLSAGWLDREMDVEMERGRYRATDGDGMVVVDFTEGPVQTHD